MGDRAESALRSRTPPRRRGIRAGKAARRRREAYINRQLAEGKELEDIPVSHTGGQQRPVYTPAQWSPETSEAEEEDASSFLPPSDLELSAPSPDLPLSRPVPGTVLLKARPKFSSPLVGG